jgi:hypothetical protein
MHWLGLVGLSWLALGASATLGFMTGLPLGRLMVIGSAGWAAFDSIRVRFREHRDCEAFHPVILLGVVGQLWPLTFPWYLVVRRRIRQGRLARAPAFHPDDIVF